MLAELAIVLGPVHGWEAGVDKRAQLSQALQHLDDQVRARFGHGIAEHRRGARQRARPPAQGGSRTPSLPADYLQLCFESERTHKFGIDRYVYDFPVRRGRLRACG